MGEALRKQAEEDIRPPLDPAAELRIIQGRKAAGLEPGNVLDCRKPDATERLRMAKEQTHAERIRLMNARISFANLPDDPQEGGREVRRRLNPIFAIDCRANPADYQDANPRRYRQTMIEQNKAKA